MATRRATSNYTFQGLLADIDSSNPSILRRIRNQRVSEIFLATSGTLTILTLFAVFMTMVYYGEPFFKSPSKMYELITSDQWYPNDKFELGTYGAKAMIYGTFIVGIPALIMSIFWGVSIAIFLSEYVPNQVTRILQPIIEFIAAIPSVIYGLIAYRYVSVWLADTFNQERGRGPLCAAIVLSFMACPIIISISIDALQSTPKMQRNAAKAFGATRYEVLRIVSLPHAKLTIFASVLLAFGRVIGETMVVLMILGNSPVIRWDLFSPAYTLTSAIANEIGDARFGSAEFDVLFVLALILLLISFIVIWISNLLSGGNPYLFRILRFLFYPLSYLSEMIGNFTQQFVKEVEISEAQIMKRVRIRRAFDVVFQTILGVITALLLFIVFSQLLRVIEDGWGQISWRFVSTWPTFTTLQKGEYGVYSAIIGSLFLVLIAMILAFPIATLTGIYLSDFAPDTWFTRTIKMAIVNISAIPSIVVGLFVYGFFSVQLNWDLGLLPGGIALAIMMIPIVTTNTIEAMRNIPQEHAISALALGATNWEASRKHRIPYSMPSIITGYILSIARIIGETAPLLLVAVGFRYSQNPYPTRLYNQGIRALPFEVYYNLLYAVPINKSVDPTVWALGSAIVLLSFVAILSVIAYLLRILLRRRYEYQGLI